MNFCVGPPILSKVDHLMPNHLIQSLQIFHITTLSYSALEQMDKRPGTRSPEPICETMICVVEISICKSLCGVCFQRDSGAVAGVELPHPCGSLHNLHGRGGCGCYASSLLTTGMNSDRI